MPPVSIHTHAWTYQPQRQPPFFPTEKEIIYYCNNEVRAGRLRSSETDKKFEMLVGTFDNTWLVVGRKSKHIV